MRKYTAFLKKYKVATSEDAQKELLKQFMFSLSPDELVLFLTESGEFIESGLTELIQSRDNSHIEFAKNYIDELETILKKDTTVLLKAA